MKDYMMVCVIIDNTTRIAANVEKYTCLVQSCLADRKLNA